MPDSRQSETKIDRFHEQIVRLDVTSARAFIFSRKAAKAQSTAKKKG